MASDPNMGFQQQRMAPPPQHPPLPRMYSGPVVSFQGGGGVMGGASPVFSIVESPAGIGGVAGVVFGGSPGSGIANAQGLIHNSASTGNLMIDALPGIKHDTGLAADWTYQEQSILEDGLSRYASEPSIMRYIKIAALLHEKTVRDVALRCRWMNRKESGKRRKHEEYYAGKKVKDMKDRVMESSLNANMQSCQSSNMSAYPFMTPPMDCVNPFPCEVVGAATSHLLEENIQLLGQIEANLQLFKLQDNLSLLSHTRNNIANILNSMREVPGIMQQMPPLPVVLHEELANSVLPSSSQQSVYGTQPGNQMKQEPHS